MLTVVSKDTNKRASKAAAPGPTPEHNRGFTGFSRFCEGTGLCCVELYLENVLGTLSHFHWLFQHSKEPDWVVKNWSN